MARGTSPEPSYIRDISRQWVLPNPAILGCSSCFLLSCCSPVDRIIFDWPQRSFTVNKTKALHVFHSDRDWHAIGCFHWPRWLVVFDAFRERHPVRGPVQRICCVETHMLQTEHQVTRHVYGPMLWKSFVCKEQMKRPISLRIQFPNCVLDLR